jgi:hypothetical protein
MCFGRILVSTAPFHSILLLFLCWLCRRMGECKCNCKSFVTTALDKFHQLHVPAVLTPWEETGTRSAGDSVGPRASMDASVVQPESNHRNKLTVRSASSCASGYRRLHGYGGQLFVNNWRWDPGWSDSFKGKRGNHWCYLMSPISWTWIQYQHHY